MPNLSDYTNKCVILGSKKASNYIFKGYEHIEIQFPMSCSTERTQGVGVNRIFTSFCLGKLKFSEVKFQILKSAIWRWY